MQDQHQSELARTSILPSLPTVPRHYLNHPTQPQIRHYSKK